MHAKSNECLLINVQRANAVFALSIRTCSKSSVRVTYHAAARWRNAGARCDRASRLAEMGTARAAHALSKIFNCARGGVGLVAFSCSKSMQWPGLNLEDRVLLIPVSRPPARNIQEPSTLGGDLSIPVSRKRFFISKSQVRSAENEYSRSRYLGSGF